MSLKTIGISLGVIIVITVGGFFAYQRASLPFSQGADSLDDPEITVTYEQENTIAEQPTDTTSHEIPDIRTDVVINGLSKPWDMIPFEDGSMLFTERGNRIRYWVDGEIIDLPAPDDTYVRGEGGMMGMARDPEFKTNSYIYTCFNSQQGGELDVRAVRWQFDPTEQTLSDRTDIVTGMPSNGSGRHSGCQLAFGPDGYLWIGTGDAAMSDNPQDPQSLGGKILRVDREGNPAEGNGGDPFDPRIYSYGHRNVQGLAFFEAQNRFGVPGISIEHGPERDDEINPLIQGNFGWDPQPGYNENVPMTDTEAYPDAISSIWSSGFPTLALSGGTIITSENWLGWDNAIVAAAQKGSRLLIVEINEELEITRETEILTNQYGRIRTAVFGTDNNLYFLTDNGGGTDQIVRISVE